MNEQNLKLEIMRKRCKTSSKVVGIIQIITIIVIIAFLIGAVLCFMQRDMIDVHLAKAVEEGMIQVDNLKISGGLFHLMIDYSQTFKAGNYAIPMFFNCMISAIICLVVTFVLSMFKSVFNGLVKNETPFSDDILKKLKTIFIVIPIMTLILMGLGHSIVICLLMWCIYSVLEYGKAIQTEVDETL